MRRHILIARRQPNLPSIWGRLDWNGGCWFDSSAVLEGGGGNSHRASMIQSNLRALVDVAVQELGDSADLTLSPRVYIDVIGRGNPGNLNVPRGSSVLLFCPTGQPGAEHAGDLWCPVLVQAGTCHALLKQSFVGKKLKEELTKLFTADDIRSRNSAHDLRELWVRRDLTAAALCPDQIKPYVQPDVDPAREEAAKTREERITAKAKHERTKKASRKSAEAGAHNAAAGKTFAAAEARRRAKGLG